MKGAYNLSSKDLDPDALTVLNCGLKFIPTPRTPTAPDQWQPALARFQRAVRLRCMLGDTPAQAMRYHVPNPAFQPTLAPAPVEAFLQDLGTAVGAHYQRQAEALAARPPAGNLTSAHRRSVRTLRADTSLIIKPADKNLGLVVLDRAWYIAEAARQLADARTYKEVPARDVAALVRGLRHTLRRLLAAHGTALPPKVLRVLQAATAAHVYLPNFYLLPKIHKLPAVARSHLPQLVGRPIVASHSWLTTPASQWLADVLNAACMARFPQVLPDSRALIRELEATSVARDSYLVTFDVVSMYPSIDTELAALACARVVPGPGGLRSCVHALLTLVMANNLFQFHGTVYQQIHGGAMGTPCMPPVANIHMAYWVEDAVRAAAAHWPALYKRFIDDGFFVWELDRPSLDAFLAALNTALPGIKLTWKVAVDSIGFMDLVITKDVSTTSPRVPLIITTFQKQHNRYLYIPRMSFHRPHVFAGFVRGELIRYVVTNTHMQGFLRMRALFMQRLLDRGYPKAWLVAVFATVSHADRHAYLHSTGPLGGAQPVGPVYVSPNGLYEMQRPLGAVINAVYDRHKHHPAVQAAMSGADRIVVAYKTNQSLGAKLVHAAD